MDLKPDESSSSDVAAATYVTQQQQQQQPEVPTSENIPTNNGDDGLIDLYAQQPQGSGADGNLSGESLEGAGGDGEGGDQAK